MEALPLDAYVQVIQRRVYGCGHVGVQEELPRPRETQSVSTGSLSMLVRALRLGAAKSRELRRLGLRNWERLGRLSRLYYAVDTVTTFAVGRARRRRIEL